MGTTGLIYVAIVAAWAAYLVPMMLKRGDEARRQPVSSAADARVLSRDPSRPRYVVRPAGASASGAASGAAAGSASGAVEEDLPPPVRHRYVPNRARRVAAMRRRRVLSILTLSLLSVTALAGLEILLWWTVAIPGALIVAFVVLTRVQLRRQARERARIAAERRARAQARHDRGPAGKPAPSPDEELTIEVKLPASSPAPAEKPAASEGLWDPVPVTLPTYVMKEKAPDRTVRTISLTDDEVFSSARTTDPAEKPAEPVVTPVEPEVKRAVGD
ncbi:hypothetical protein AB0H36_20775 [Kribbella sp. NPDC050820]|uniref:divisome protein SepX/GlpR n=1 Tax=Kribbella sp. NPDC050820 TaxID=3155408 RepID=UPI0033CDD9AD